MARSATSKSPVKERAKSPAKSPAKVRSPKPPAAKGAGSATSMISAPWAISLALALAACASATLRAIVLRAVNGTGSVPLIDFFHATAVAHEYRKFAEPQGAVQRLFAVVVTALGGTTVMSFLLGQPCGWLCDNETLTAYVVAWWLMHYAPFDFFYRVLDSSASSRFVMGVLDDISWGVAITKWGMFKAIAPMHPAPAGSTVAALLSGLVAGCGGGVIQQGASLLKKEWSLCTPNAFRVGTIGFGVKATSFCVVLSYILLDPHGHLVSALPSSVTSLAGGRWPLGHDETIYVAIITMIHVATVRSTLARLMA